VVESWKRGSIETCKIVEVLPSRWEGTDKDGLRICDDLTPRRPKFETGARQFSVYAFAPPQQPLRLCKCSKNWF
jgi:hypothetical protein